jgi:hypothetical protein
MAKKQEQSSESSRERTNRFIGQSLDDALALKESGTSIGGLEDVEAQGSLSIETHQKGEQGESAQALQAAWGTTGSRSREKRLFPPRTPGRILGCISKGSWKKVEQDVKKGIRVLTWKGSCERSSSERQRPRKKIRTTRGRLVETWKLRARADPGQASR